MNAVFQEYKRQVDESRECKDKSRECKREYKRECKIVFVDDIKTEYEIKPMEFSIGEKSREYNRAKEKETVRKMSEEYIDR